MDLGAGRGVSRGPCVDTAGFHGPPLCGLSHGGGPFLCPPASGFRKGGTAMNPNHTHRSLRILTFCALLVAMSIVFSRVLSISTGFLRFNLGSLPVVLAAVLFGPGAGFVVGALADAIGGVLAGYAINPLITLGAGAVGFFAGWGWRHLPARTDGLRLAGVILLGHIVGSMVLNSLALRLFYGYAWRVLAARIPNALVLAGAEFVLVRALLANHALMAADRGGHTGSRSCLTSKTRSPISARSTGRATSPGWTAPAPCWPPWGTPTRGCGSSMWPAPTARAAPPPCWTAACAAPGTGWGCSPPPTSTGSMSASRWTASPSRTGTWSGWWSRSGLRPRPWPTCPRSSSSSPPWGCSILPGSGATSSCWRWGWGARWIPPTSSTRRRARSSPPWGWTTSKSWAPPWRTSRRPRRGSSSRAARWSATGAPPRPTAS